MLSLFLHCCQWPPAKGTTGTIAATLNVLQAINNGSTITGAVTFDGILLANKTVELATVATLPIAKGPFTLAKNITVPATLPISGSIGLQISGQNEQQQALFCVNVAFTI